MLMGVLCLVVASCDKDAPLLNVADDNAIGFQTAVKTSTRADQTDLERDGFSVWGYYTANTGNTMVFDARKVYYSNGWRYDNPEYWVNNVPYTFYALYPEYMEGQDAYTLNGSTITYDTSKQVDLLYAYFTCLGSVPEVPLNFNHALAAIDFSLKLAGNYTATYKVTNIQWGGVYTQGSFTMGSGNITWNSIGDMGEIDITTFANEVLSTTAITNADNLLLVLPQSQTDASLTITLDINGESRTITRNIAINWEPSKRYTYNITIDPLEITIETTPWETPKIDDVIVQ